MLFEWYRIIKKAGVLNHSCFFDGADSRTRTDDLRITNALLYQLSHISIFSFVIDFCSAVGFGRNAFPQKYSRSAHYRSHYSLFLHLILLVRFVHRTALWASPLNTSKDLRITNQLLYLLSHSSIFSFKIGFCSATFFEKMLAFSKSLTKKSLMRFWKSYP